MLRPIRYEEHRSATATRRPTPENVGTVDRWISGIYGSAMLLSAVRRGGLGGLIGSCLGSALLYRGITGHCPVQESLSGRTASTRRGIPATAETIAAAFRKKPYRVRPPLKEPPDRVQEASEESFPASDAPAWGLDRT